jgi:serine protease Do
MPIPLTQLEEAVTGVVDRVGPSVVTISTVQTVRDQYWRPFPVEGVGSGVIVSKDGLIVTNHHVIRNARTARVELPDGRSYEATYVGGDPDSDLAILRVPAQNLPYAELGDSDALKVGQLAIAIGSPFGNMLEGPSVTVGVVSALRRTLQGPGAPIEGLVQTDAPINPGNSGGALLDSSGRVIAINTAIIPHAQGIGFAVPVNRVRDVLEQVLEHGRVRRPWLGIAGVTLNRKVAKEHGLDPPGGVLVFQVDEGSPAARAHLEKDDVIRSFDNQPIKDVTQLRERIAALRPGAIVDIGYERFGDPRKVTLTLRERPQR